MSISLGPVGATSVSAVASPVERISPGRSTNVRTCCWSLCTFRAASEPRVHCGQVERELWLNILSSRHSPSASTRGTGISLRPFTEPWVLLCQLFFPGRLSAPQTGVCSEVVANFQATVKVLSTQFYLKCSWTSQMPMVPSALSHLAPSSVCSGTSFLGSWDTPLLVLSVIAVTKSVP